uniref:Uncharacterized protein n=1 Tax=Oryza sativa subsp. japonica TaxID=39947 RepID=Q8H4P5_ORYSJ|nr:hypothetical protein [Oryza sativa Japonica Group]
MLPTVRDVAAVSKATTTSSCRDGASGAISRPLLGCSYGCQLPALVAPSVVAAAPPPPLLCPRRLPPRSPLPPPSPPPDLAAPAMDLASPSLLLHSAACLPPSPPLAISLPASLAATVIPGRGQIWPGKPCPAPSPPPHCWYFLTTLLEI